jgi:hypothetical protein
VEPQILINEIYPNPETGSEWVELIVIEEIAEDFSLEAYTIFDSYHQIYKFSDKDKFIDQLLVVELSGLNNDQDSVVLKDAHGNILDSFSYIKTEKGKSWAREIDSNIFSLNEASRNSVNPPITATPSAEPSASVSTSLNITPTTITIAPIQTLTKTPTPINSIYPSKETRKYHYHDLQKIKLESQEKTFENRTGRLFFFGKKQGQAELVDAIIGSSLIILSSLFLIYAKIKNKYH